MIRSRVIVFGDVQGVFFRDTCRRTAIGHRVTGWVRNLADGTVEAVFEGEPKAVGEMVAWSRHGPPTSTVDRVLVVEEDVEGLSGFRVLPTAKRPADDPAQ
jgi:acylphosphatase